MSTDKDKKIKEKYDVETGFFEDGFPFARIGNKLKIIVNIEALSFKHEPPSGFTLKQFIKSARPFLNEYTLYLVGRKQNLPENYLFDKMAEDYAKMIRREFRGPVDVMGASTGGQLAHYLAANYPDVVRKLILISTAFRLSERGVEIERNAEKYFKQEKYGKALAATLDLIFSSKIIKGIVKFLICFIGKRWMGKVQYPNDPVRRW